MDQIPSPVTPTSYIETSSMPLAAFLMSKGCKLESSLTNFDDPRLKNGRTFFKFAQTEASLGFKNVFEVTKLKNEACPCDVHKFWENYGRVRNIALSQGSVNPNNAK